MLVHAFIVCLPYPYIVLFSSTPATMPACIIYHHYTGLPQFASYTWVPILPLCNIQPPRCLSPAAFSQSSLTLTLLSIHIHLHAWFERTFAAITSVPSQQLAVCVLAVCDHSYS